MRTLVLHPVLSKAAGSRNPTDALAEAVSLARALGLDVVDARITPVPRRRAGTLFGSGKVEELTVAVAEAEIGLVIIDGPLSPVQQRNLERAWKAKVLDRTGLILEIFGERAQTREGVLQVELAHLSYQKSRLVRSWTHLERQRGGFGFLGGPGETQIEADRRALDERIDRIKEALAKSVRTRGQHRAARKRSDYPTVALVGYTNAGKSTLFNRMTGVGGARPGHAVRDARPHHARGRARPRPARYPVRHGRLHLRPSDPAGRRLPRDARRGDRRRSDPPRPRHRPPRERHPGRKRARDPRRARDRGRGRGAHDRGLEQGRHAGARRRRGAAPDRRAHAAGRSRSRR